MLLAPSSEREEISLTEKKATLTVHFTQCCLNKNFTRDKEARKTEAKDNFRDGIGPFVVIRYQIPSDPPIGQEEGKGTSTRAPTTLSKILGRNGNLLILTL